LTDNYTE